MQPRRARRARLWHPQLSAGNERHFAEGLHAGSMPGRVWQLGRYSHRQGRGDAGLAEPGQERKAGERKDGGEAAPRKLEGLLRQAVWGVKRSWLGESPLLPCTGLARFPDSRCGGGRVLGGPGSPPRAETVCHAEEEPASVRAAHMGGSWQRGRAAHMALPDTFPKG